MPLPLHQGPDASLHRGMAADEPGTILVAPPGQRHGQVTLDPALEDPIRRTVGPRPVPAVQNRTQSRSVPLGPTLKLVDANHFFIEMKVRGTIADLARLYGDWASGTGTYANLRSRREREGVPAEWNGEALVRALEGGQVGLNESAPTGASLRTRSISGSQMLVELTDQRRGGILVGPPYGNGAPPIAWTTAVDLRQEAPGVVSIRHAIGTTRPGNCENPYIGGCQKIVLDLLASPNLLSPAAPDRVIRISQEDASDYVREVLLDPDRAVPHLVVTHRAHTKDLLVDPEALQRQLATQVQVVVIEAPKGWDQFSASMEKAGFSRTLSVFDGGVRLYSPLLKPGDEKRDHRLWTRFLIEPNPKSSATWIIQEAAGLAAELGCPAGFMKGIDALDRRRELDRLALAVESPAVQVAAEDHQALLKDLKGILEMALEENARLEASKKELAAEVARLGAQEVSLREQLNRASARSLRGPDREDPQGVQDAARAVLAGNPTLSQTLRFLAENFPQRLVALPSAFKSAEESSGFLDRRKAFQMLQTLVTTFYEDGLVGRGIAQDPQCVRWFGRDGYASHEKRNLTPEGRQLRSFPYDGQMVFMDAHLKVGASESTAECMRCHFHWDAERRLIVIGHLGKHIRF